MTTIAWDGRMLASDSLGVIDGSLKMASQKIFVLDDGRLYGGSGEFQDVLAVRDWLNTGGEKPTVDHYAGLLIAKDGQPFRLEDKLIPLPLTEECYAVGSGRDFAIAAMALGQTAREAVQLATRFDVWTGGEIVTLALSTEGDTDVCP